MVRLIAFARRHRAVVAAGVVAALAGAVVVLVWFQPQKLVIDQRVSEAAPQATASAAVTETLASGPFESLEHTTTGTASLQRLQDGSHVVRLEALDTSNGPDLRVYLSKLPKGLGWRDYGRDFVELGKLKGNIGDQNYAVPAGTDVSQYQSIVIWCVRFAVGFGVAQFA